MSVYDKIQNGDYMTKIEPNPRPPIPLLLRKRASELTEDEIATLAVVKAKYVAAEEAHKSNYQERIADGNRLIAQFQHDLEEEAGMLDHPKAALLYSKAYEDGHASGFAEIHHVYYNLLELVK